MPETTHDAGRVQPDGSLPKRPQDLPHSQRENPMKPIHIRRYLDSETLTLPELKPLIGKTVEIIIREEIPTVRGKGPYDAFFALAGQQVVDLDAYKEIRAASMI